MAEGSISDCRRRKCVMTISDYVQERETREKAGDEKKETKK